MGGFRLAQVGFRSPWAGVGLLVLVGGRGFAYHGPPRVLGLVVVAKNGFDLVYLFILLLFGFVGMDLAVVDVDGGSRGGSGGGWFGFGFWIWNLDFIWVF